MAYELKLLTGNANRPLAEEIAQYLHVPMADAEVTRFSDGEVYVQVDENVRGTDVFVIQPTCPPVNDTLMELLIMVDAMKRASARRITAVLPYYGYARQDRKVQSRVPISARLVADLLEAAGIHRVLALDLHAGQIQGFFSVPVDHLFAGPVVMIDYLRKKDLRDPVIVAPDAGGVERARAMAKRFDAGLAIIDKRREGPNSAVAMHLIGDVKGRDAVVIDDIVDTAGTLTQAVSALEREGARRIMACGVHAVLSGPAIDRIADRGGRRYELGSSERRQARGGAHHGALGRAAPRRGDPAHSRRRIRLDSVRVTRRQGASSHGDDAGADDQAARRKRQGFRQAPAPRGRRSRRPLRRQEGRVGHGGSQSGAADDPRPRGHDPAAHPPVRR